MLQNLFEGRHWFIWWIGGKVVQHGGRTTLVSPPDVLSVAQPYEAALGFTLYKTSNPSELPFLSNIL